MAASVVRISNELGKFRKTWIIVHVESTKLIFWDPFDVEMDKQALPK